jgi:hypothetical protein
LGTLMILIGVAGYSIPAIRHIDEMPDAFSLPMEAAGAATGHKVYGAQPSRSRMRGEVTHSGGGAALGCDGKIIANRKDFAVGKQKNLVHSGTSTLGSVVREGESHEGRRSKNKYQNG